MRAHGEGRLFLRGSTWWAQLYEAGRQVRFSTRTKDPLEAAGTLRERLAEVRAGTVGRADAPVTFGELAARAERGWRASGGRGLRRQLAALAHLRASFGDDPASTIDGDRVRAYVDTRLAAGAAHATVNVELAVLRLGFNAAADAGRPATPPRIRSLRPAPPRSRRLSMDEVERVLRHLPPDLVPVVVVLWTTGWRVGEVLSREFRHVVDEQLRVEVGEAKVVSKAYAYPLTTQLRDLVERQRRSAKAIAARTGTGPSRLFHRATSGGPITYQTFRRAWVAATAKAGLPGAHVHDLRRSNVAATEPLVGRAVGRTLTGQSDSIYTRYGVPDSRQLAAAATTLERLRLRLPRGQGKTAPGTARRAGARETRARTTKTGTLDSRTSESGGRA